MWAGGGGPLLILTARAIVSVRSHVTFQSVTRHSRNPGGPGGTVFVFLTFLSTKLSLLLLQPQLAQGRANHWSRSIDGCWATGSTRAKHYCSIGCCDHPDSMYVVAQPCEMSL